ncbi:hypothetical protein EV175_003481 [Coemansia sp. RSA 1933]|nr:hypothetical protein EV175_003481 [Coemansia sp. RSA 1933]
MILEGILRLGIDSKGKTIVDNIAVRSDNENASSSYASDKTIALVPLNEDRESDICEQLFKLVESVPKLVALRKALLKEPAVRIPIHQDVYDRMKEDVDVAKLERYLSIVENVGSVTPQLTPRVETALLGNNVNVSTTSDAVGKNGKLEYLLGYATASLHVLNGIRWYDIDLTKWALEQLDAARGLKRLPRNEVMKGRAAMKLKRAERFACRVDYGTPVKELAMVMESEFVAEVREHGRKWLVIEGFIYNIKDFIEMHPCGPRLTKSGIGKDMTNAFNGRAYNHHYSARTLMNSTMRVGKII